MAEVRVRLAGEDQVHRSLGREVVARAAEQEGAAPVFEGIGGGDFFVNKNVRERLRARMKLPPNKPLFLDDAGALRGKPEAVCLADLVRLSERDAGDGHALVVLEDTDGKPERIEATEAVGEWFGERPRKAAALVIGTPHRDAEAWIVAGLQADGEIQPQRRKAARLLRFDPCLHPEKLTSAPNIADTDAKRVLGFLLSDEEQLQALESKPPPPDQHEELFARAFSDFPALLAAPAARETLLAQFHREVLAAIRTLVQPRGR